MYYIGDEEIEALKNLFKKKKLFRYSSDHKTECDLFEEEFATHIKSSHALILSSGTNALVTAMIAAGIQPGDEVLIPTYTFVATAAAVVQVGAIPILVNIDENLSLDITEAKTKITNKTKALILVHMDGLVADVASAKKMTDETGLIFIEDVAQAIGASFENQYLGTFGLFGCFSLNENKNISCGEGGILITNKRELFEKAFCYHDTPMQFSPSKKGFLNQITPFMGASMRVSEIQGAIMRVQLGRLNKILGELRARKNIFIEHLINIKNVQLVLGYSPIGECSSSIHLQFSEPSITMSLGKILREHGFSFLPVTARPAHVSWKYTHLFGAQGHAQPSRNPFLLSESAYTYETGNYLSSVDILMRTVKMEIDSELSLEETANQAQTLARLMA